MDDTNANQINPSIRGLTENEVKKRIEKGLTNQTDISTDKTTKEIILSNTLTYFNLIFLIISIIDPSWFFSEPDLSADHHR